MCSGAIALYKIPRVIIGEDVNFTGEAQFLRSRGMDVRIINEPSLINMMREFIVNNPTLWNEDIAE